MVIQQGLEIVDFYPENFGKMLAFGWVHRGFEMIEVADEMMVDWTYCHSGDVMSVVDLTSLLVRGMKGNVEVCQSLKKYVIVLESVK